jgi:diguanylate cyclase (GGDEF)-like protein
MSRAKILIVDDRPENLLVLESLLDEPDIELIKADSGNEALRKILDHEFALVLLDVQMPDMDGYEVAELLRGNKKTRHVPIIFVTAKNKEDASIFKGYDSGAVDYLFKPLEPVILKSKVGVFLELYRHKEELLAKTHELDRRLADLEELKHLLEQTNEQLTHLSKKDGLTGLLNRRSFDETVEREWQRGLRNQQSLALLLVDIDFFKAYNDNYGHTMGDEALKAVADTLNGCAQRYVDRVARYGGEEFVIILPDTDLHGAEVIAERVCSAVHSLNIPHVGAKERKHLTVSVGASAATPRNDISLLDVIELADSKLYEAKEAGRNCWRSALCNHSFKVENDHGHRGQ